MTAWLSDLIAKIAGQAMAFFTKFIDRKLKEKKIAIEADSDPAGQRRGRRNLLKWLRENGADPRE